MTQHTFRKNYIFYVLNMFKRSFLQVLYWMEKFIHKFDKKSILMKFKYMYINY